jgi:hypothetical protein
MTDDANPALLVMDGPVRAVVLGFVFFEIYEVPPLAIH